METSKGLWFKVFRSSRALLLHMTGVKNFGFQVQHQPRFSSSSHKLNSFHSLVISFSKLTSHTISSFLTGYFYLFWTFTSFAMGKNDSSKAATAGTLKSKHASNSSSKKPAQSHAALPSSSRRKLSFRGFAYTIWRGHLSDSKSEKRCILHRT